MGRTAVEQAVLGDLPALNSAQHRPFGWAQGRPFGWASHDYACILRLHINNCE